MRLGRKILSIGLLIATILIAAGVPSSAAYRRPGSLIRINMNPYPTDAVVPRGQGGNMESTVSASGRYVAFATKDERYPETLSGSFYQVYLYDAKEQDLTLISVSSAALPGLGGHSMSPSISASGRFVAFESEAINLVADDTNLSNDVFVHDTKKGTTERVSVTSAGDQAGSDPDLGIRGNEASPSLSPDGQSVAFSSRAADLIVDDAGMPMDTNDTFDVFLHDRILDTTARESVGPAGQQSNGAATGPSLTRGARFLVFCNRATNLTDRGEADPGRYLIRRDLQKDENIGVFLASNGASGGGHVEAGVACSTQSVSEDGRFIAFATGGSQMVPNKSTSPIWSDVYLRDVERGRTTRISVNSFGEEGSGVSSFPSISSGGRFVSLSSNANNLGVNDRGGPPQVGLTPLVGASGDSDIFVYDIETGAVERVSVALSGRDNEPCSTLGADALENAISATGRYVSFSSCYDTLVEGEEPNGLGFDVFLRDRGEALGIGDPAINPEDAGGEPGDELCITPDICVPPVCVPPVCIPPQGVIDQADPTEDGVSQTVIGGDLSRVSIAYRPSLNDIFVKQELTTFPSFDRARTGTDAVVYGFRFKVGTTEYEARSSALRGGTFRLLDCTDSIEGVCTQVADLRGGYGTTGAEVVLSIPLDAVGLRDGGELTDVEAFTGIGSLLTGAQKILDTISVN